MFYRRHIEGDFPHGLPGSPREVGAYGGVIGHTYSTRGCCTFCNLQFLHKTFLCPQIQSDIRVGNGDDLISSAPDSLLFRENRPTCHILFKSRMGHSIRVYYMLNTKLSLYPYPLAATPAHHSNNIGSTSHVCRVVSDHCFTSLFAQSWQYRDRRKPEVRTISYCYRRFKGSFSCTVL